MIQIPTLNELNNTVDEMIKSETSFSATTPGSVVRAIARSMNSTIYNLYGAINNAITSTSVGAASGSDLDTLASIFGLERKTASGTTTMGNVNTFKFMIPGGRTATQYAGGAFTIPAGAVITTKDYSATFYTTEAANFGAGDIECYVNLQSSGSGSFYNLPEGTLTKHNIAGYTDLQCTNVWGITGASDTESDNELRYRILHARETFAKANTAAVRLAALSVAGVADIKLDMWARGPGSFDIYVVSEAGRTSDALVEEVQAAINETQAVGVFGTATKPDEMRIRVWLRLAFSDELSESDRAQARTSVQTSIKSYLDNIPLGGELVFNNILAIAMGAYAGIKDVNIYAMTLNDVSIPMANFVCESYEKILADPNITTPVEAY